MKWAGGKTKLLSELRARAPRGFRRYYEPFLGGAALFLDLAPAKAVLGDLNHALIDTYRALASNVEEVISILEVLRAGYLGGGERFYYFLREEWNRNEFATSAERAAAFILLNKTGYNGLWRVNRDGKYNVPAGKYTNPSIFDADHLRAAGAAFARAELRVGTFKTTTADVGAGDFVYFDPPYDPLNKTSSFTAYTKDAFGDAEQAELAQWAAALCRRGATVVLSNNDTPLIRDLYQGFQIETVKCARSINSKGTRRGKIDEVLITGVPLYQAPW